MWALTSMINSQLRQPDADELSTEVLRVWIDYDGEAKQLDVAFGSGGNGETAEAAGVFRLRSLPSAHSRRQVRWVVICNWHGQHRPFYIFFYLFLV